MIGVLAGLLWLDHKLGPRHIPMAIVVGAVAIAAFREVAAMIAQSQVRVLWISGLVGTVAIATSPSWATTGPMLIAGLVLIAIFLEQMIRNRLDDALRRVGCTVFATMYLGICLAMILSLRHWGIGILVMFLACVKCTDIGAYFTGKAFGKHKMIVWLSPGKTWEGLASGVIAATVVGVVIHLIFGIVRISLWQAGLFGAVVGLAGQFGDLCESLLKRSAKIKDSGAVLPEFGGVMDILDSPLLASPIALLLLRWM